MKISGTTRSWPQFSWAANAARSGIHLAKGLLPLPFTANNVLDVARDGTIDQQAKARDIIGLVLFGQAARHVASEGRARARRAA